MADKTNISFAHHTGSPWIGCTKVNTDCANCYADYLDVKRFSKTMFGCTKKRPVRHWGPGAPRQKTVGFWTDARRWNQKPWVCNFCGTSHAVPQAHPCGEGKIIRAGDDLSYSRARVFPSLCDWLDEEAPIEWLVDFLKLINETPNLTWMLFTKRPQNFFHILGYVWQSYAKKDIKFASWVCRWVVSRIPPHNVWIFGSAGCQETADQIIPLLLPIPAVVRGISCEPMTGPVDFSRWFYKQPLIEVGNAHPSEDVPSKAIQVVIFGGESDQAKPARPCNLDWIRDGVQQCRAAGVKAYVKQLGSNPMMLENTPFVLADRAGADPSEWPGDLRVQELPT